MKNIHEELRQFAGSNQRVMLAYDKGVALVTQIDDEHPNMSKNLRMYKFDLKTLEVTEDIDLDKSVEEIVENLYSKVDVKEFLRQILHEESVLQLVELAALLKKHPEATIGTQNKRGCLYLQVPNPDPGASDYKLYLKG